MIQIDMDMPKNCFECKFLVFSRYGLNACRLKPGLTLSRDFTTSFPRKRHADCPVIDVNALETF